MKRRGGRLAAALAVALALAGADAAPGSANLPVDLADLPRPSLTIEGAVQNESLGIPFGGWEGRPIAEECDLDGDGVDDLALGALGYDTQHGRVFVRRGGPDLVGGVSTELAATVVIDGFGDSKAYGTWTECAGDFDGDGVDDLLISSDGRGSGADVPVVYVVLGGSGFFTASPIDVGDDEGRVIPIQAPAGQSLDDGSAAAVGDLDGDGRDDLAFYLPWTAKLYLVPGREAGEVDGVIDPTDPAQAREVLTAAKSYPTTITEVGDLDGDGLRELAIADSEASAASGRIEVIAGALLADDSEPSFDLAGEAPGDRLLFRVSGPAGSSAGFALAGVPDLNGDGRDELAIGSPWPYGDTVEEPARPEASGQVQVVFGTTAHDPIDLAALGAGGFSVTGPGEASQLGAAVAATPDLNGDGLADLLVGAPFAHNPAMAANTYAGRAYVIYGRAAPASIETAALDGADGAGLYGTHLRNNLGLNVASPGDIDGNGLPDLAFGGLAPSFTGKGRVVIARLGVLPEPPGEDPDTPPTDEPGGTLPGDRPVTVQPSGSAQPGPPSPPPAVKSTVRRLAKRIKPDIRGVARLGRVRCPSGGGLCRVSAPRRVRVKIAGEKFWARLLVPRRLAPGRGAAVRVKLGKAARKALDGGRFAVEVRLKLRSAGR